MTDPMQVIGICRFSYPALGGFQIEHASTKNRSAFLHHPTRMSEQFRFFETICLQGLKAQNDPDFIFLIVIRENELGHHEQRLTRLLETVPQAGASQARPSGPHRQVLQAVLNGFQDDRRPCLQFRHDDNDAIAVDYVAKLRQTAEDCRAYLARHQRITVDFNHGVIRRPDAKGFQAKPIFKPL